MRSWHESWTGPETSEPSLTEKITHKVQNVQSKRPKTAKSASVSKIRLAPILIEFMVHIITHFIIYNHSSQWESQSSIDSMGNGNSWYLHPHWLSPRPPEKWAQAYHFRHRNFRAKPASKHAWRHGADELVTGLRGAPPIWGWVKTLVPLVNIKIAGKWMFIPLKMVLIGIDP